MIFKYVLISVLGAFVLYVLLLPKQTALRKMTVLLFVIGMLVFAVNPDWSTVIANYFGIVRGVDFLFYLSHLMLFFVGFVYYLKFKEMEARFAKLVRTIALHRVIDMAAFHYDDCGNPSAIK